MASMDLPNPAPCTFALCLGNRGFFPSALIAEARSTLGEVLLAAGHRLLTAPDGVTRHGAVESAEEGRAWGRWLADHRHEVDGVILSLPNFGDENGVVVALRDAGVPILVHAWPDELQLMAPAHRRDAFCGKLSVLDVFRQVGITCTALKPHVVHPRTRAFAANLAHFATVCRVVRGLRQCVIGAIGVRTTAFKTVRVDEVALSRVGVTVEATDLADLLTRVRDLSWSDPAVQAKALLLRDYADVSRVPEPAFANLCRLGVALDQIATELGCDALALRCWIELQRELGISPCLLLSDLNHRGLPAACEVDIGNAVVMRALGLATGGATTLLDWNNNFGEELDKVILFHCGPVPQALMRAKGEVTDHVLLQPVLGKGCSWGCNTGRIAAIPFTYGGLMTDDGRVEVYLGEGAFTEDAVPVDFFGCAGVAHIPHLEEVLLGMAARATGITSPSPRVWPARPWPMRWKVTSATTSPASPEAAMPLITGRDAVLDLYRRAASTGWTMPCLGTENLTTSKACLATAQSLAERRGWARIPLNPRPDRPLRPSATGGPLQPLPALGYRTASRPGRA